MYQRFFLFSLPAFCLFNMPYMVPKILSIAHEIAYEIYLTGQ